MIMIKILLLITLELKLDLIKPPNLNSQSNIFL